MESTRSKILVAVVVAVVGTVVTTIMGWIPNPFGPVEPERVVDGGGAAPDVTDARNWLVIEGVEMFGRSPGPVKVTARVNGTPFIYPSLGGIEWMEIGPAMSSQNFALPTGVDQLKIRFEMETQSGMRFLSQQTDVVELPSGLPHAGNYNLHQVQNRSRSAPVSAAIRYSVTTEP